MFWLQRQLWRLLRMRFVCPDCQRVKLLMSLDHTPKDSEEPK